jgi:hypothetical protein
MLSIARSTLTIPVQFSFLAINGFGILLGTVYNANTPDLYPNNAHHKLGWILTWTVCVQVGMALINVVVKRLANEGNVNERAAFIPISTEIMAQHQRFHDIQDREAQRFSNDSGQGTERNTESLRTNSIASARSSPGNLSPQEELDHEDVELHEEKAPQAVNNTLQSLVLKLPILMSSRAQATLSVLYETINRLIPILGFVALTTGVVTYGGIFVSRTSRSFAPLLLTFGQRADKVFSGLAHFIKGGVFFWYGILTLGRWAGCFADRGWVSRQVPPSYDSRD